MSILDPLLLSKDSTIREAMEHIERNRSGIAIVIDDSDRLIGTVTDGDIRRAILAQMGLDAPVAGIMARNPITAPISASNEELLSLMNMHRIQQVPIVDENYRPVRLGLMRDFTEGGGNFAMAVIMAGGEGRRLRPLTESVPKPLIKVGEVSLLENVIEGLTKIGVRRVFVSLNYKGDVIREHLGSGDRYGVSISYLDEQEKMGTAGALSLLPESPGGTVLVVNADIITKTDFTYLYNYHRRHGCAVTVAAVEWIVKVPYGVLKTAGHLLLDVEEKPETRTLCSAGICVLEPHVLRLAGSKLPMDMPELLREVLSEGLPISVFPIVEKWLDVGTPEDLYRARAGFPEGRAFQS
jgi:dTDP-glucose pyrophosphorylase